MSGTSMDGVDISIIKSDGYDEFSCIFDDYYRFDEDLYAELINLRDKVVQYDDLNKYSVEINEMEKKFTLFNGKIVQKVIYKRLEKIDFIGFHGQTIFHEPGKKISRQLGDGKLLSQITKCSVINNFRKNDLNNGGQGAPLTPIYHNLLSRIIFDKFQIKYPMNIINIGGITNVTQIISNFDNNGSNLYAYDIAPGNCLIDEWIRKHGKGKFDQDGNLAKSGKVNKLILNQAIDNFTINSFENSLDIKNFDISFVKGLSLEDGCATLTTFTAYMIAEGLKRINHINNLNVKNYLLCGGGRKNKILIERISEFFKGKEIKLNNIDDYDFNGDFIESQAFGYLAIRSNLNLPISFPNTTRCEKAISGGIIEKNY